MHYGCSVSREDGFETYMHIGRASALGMNLDLERYVDLEPMKRVGFYQTSIIFHNSVNAGKQLLQIWIPFTLSDPHLQSEVSVN